MSLVVFPFKREDISVVERNLATAARHDIVDEVWAVAAAEDATMGEVATIAKEMSSDIPIRVFPQERKGSFRPGKGDGMNTAIAMSAERGFARTHFYDADITNFDGSWIEGAESAADRGYGVVRHRFPRAATDAMITWMITRPGLAMLFPGTLLPRLGQPLGGELLLSADAVEALASDPFVTARSDWGIDTVITHATSTLDTLIYEHNVADGKRHALYGSLAEIRDMVLECLDAVASLAGRASPGAVIRADPPAPVPSDLKEMTAYDLESTRREISEPPDTAEREVLARIGVGENELDEGRWGVVVGRLLSDFEL
ncbi:MAG: hypothetical protein PVG83_10400, partial [Acidimicrobiia bacterium]